MIETFQNVDFSAGGEYEPTRENFPWAKIFFNLDGVDHTAETITEHFSGAVFDLSNTNGTVIDTAADKEATSGDMSQTITGVPSAIYVSRTTGDANKFKTGSGDGVSFDDDVGGAFPIVTSTGNAGAGSSSVAGTAFSISAATTASHFYGMASHSAAINAFEGGDTDAWNDLATAFALHSIMNIDNKITLTKVDLVGMLIYSMKISQPDIHEAMHWMQNMWSEGNYWLYPPWKGLTGT